jgi:type IV secretory pathway VirB10-like protein
MRLSSEQELAERRRDANRRLQIGGTGIALIALLVGLSTLLTGEAREEAATAQAQAEAAGAPAVTAPPASGDPLTVPAATPAPAPAARANPQDAAPAPPLVPDLEPDPGLRTPRPR